jgi:hypothetical protein
MCAGFAGTSSVAVSDMLCCTALRISLLTAISTWLSLIDRHGLDVANLLPLISCCKAFADAITNCAVLALSRFQLGQDAANCDIIVLISMSRAPSQLWF